MKIEASVKSGTLYIAVSTFLMSVLMESVYLILNRWSIYVLFGNLLGFTVAVLNFFIMGLTVQKAVSKGEKEAADLSKLSLVLRNLGMFIAVVIGVVFDCFNTVAVILPLFFPRIAIGLKPLLDKRKSKQ